VYLPFSGLVIDDRTIDRLGVGAKMSRSHKTASRVSERPRERKRDGVKNNVVVVRSMPACPVRIIRRGQARTGGMQACAFPSKAPLASFRRDARL
jgi:hypothetical protein